MDIAKRFSLSFICSTYAAYVSKIKTALLPISRKLWACNAAYKFHNTINIKSQLYSEITCSSKESSRSQGKRDWSSCLWQSLLFPTVSRRCIKNQTRQGFPAEVPSRSDRIICRCISARMTLARIKLGTGGRKGSYKWDSVG